MGNLQKKHTCSGRRPCHQRSRNPRRPKPKRLCPVPKVKRRSGPRVKYVISSSTCPCSTKLPLISSTRKSPVTKSSPHPSFPSVKLRASLAKQGLRRLAAEGKIKEVVHHSAQVVYTKV